MILVKKLPAGFKNKVDLLLEEIKKIQEKCEHRFFLSVVYKPKETLESGTFRVET